MAEHHIVEIHQERPGEWSGVCSCGMHYKHQPFGKVVLYCERNIDRSYRDALKVAYRAWRVEREERAAAESREALEALTLPLGIVLHRSQIATLMSQVEPMEDLAAQDAKGQYWVWGTPIYASDTPVIPRADALFDGRHVHAHYDVEPTHRAVVEGRLVHVGFMQVRTTARDDDGRPVFIDLPVETFVSIDKIETSEEATHGG